MLMMMKPQLCRLESKMHSQQMEVLYRYRCARYFYMLIYPYRSKYHVELCVWSPWNACTIETFSQDSTFSCCEET